MKAIIKVVKTSNHTVLEINAYRYSPEALNLLLPLDLQFVLGFCGLFYIYHKHDFKQIVTNAF
jgi:hypothetical protein